MEIILFYLESYLDAKLFKINAETGIIQLRGEQLDRESIDRHEFRVIATNRRNGPLNPKEKSFLRVNVTVNDVNDNPPTFEFHNYGAGISDIDQIGKEVLTVKVKLIWLIKILYFFF